MRRFWCTAYSISVRRRINPLVFWTKLSPYPSLVVDSMLEIVDAYQRKIIDLEHQILLKPKMAAVRQRKFPFSLVLSFLNSSHFNFRTDILHFTSPHHFGRPYLIQANPRSNQDSSLWHASIRR